MTFKAFQRPNIVARLYILIFEFKVIQGLNDFWEIFSALSTAKLQLARSSRLVWI